MAATSSVDAGNEVAVERLVEAARRELASGGLRAMSFRRMGEAVGATSGALAYHIGAKSQILDEVVRRERLRDRDWHSNWRRRFEGLGAFDRHAVAALLEHYLEASVQADARVTQMIWMDLLLRSARDAEVAALVTPWIAERRAFWLELFSGRIAEPDIWAGMAIAYVTDEGFNGLAIGDDADYRLIRRMVIERLSSRLERDGIALEPLFVRLVEDMDRRLDLPDEAEMAKGLGEGARRDSALAACYILIEQGAEGLTHRAVAERAGLSRSAVGYYFRTAPDLIRAAISGVYLIANGWGELPPSPTITDPVLLRGLAVVRGELAVVLAAARDPQLAPYVVDQRRWRGRSYVRLLRARGYSGLDLLDGQVASMVATGQTLLADVDGDDRRSQLIGWLTARHRDMALPQP